MNSPLLSILIPSLESRVEQRTKLIAGLEHQIGDAPVEVLTLVDNKRRSVGLKRQALLDTARGEYVAFVDDDDDVSEDYTAYLLAGCLRRMDVVTFLQRCEINGKVGHVHFSAEHRRDEPFAVGLTAKRRPWHICAWRKELAQQGRYLDTNYGEDAAWVAQVAPLARNSTHIDRVLHTYRHGSWSEALPE